MLNKEMMSNHASSVQTKGIFKNKWIAYFRNTILQQISGGMEIIFIKFLLQKPLTKDLKFNVIG